MPARCSAAMMRAAQAARPAGTGSTADLYWAIVSAKLGARSTTLIQTESSRRIVQTNCPDLIELEPTGRAYAAGANR